MHDVALERVAERLASARRVLVLTGAGVSAEYGTSTSPGEDAWLPPRCQCGAPLVGVNPWRTRPSGRVDVRPEGRAGAVPPSPTNAPTGGAA